MKVGDRMLVEGYPVTIVAIFAENSFAAGYPAEEWTNLATGVLVVDDEAGIIHYPKLEGLNIEPLNI